MIHVFYGPDDFSQAEALAELKGALGSPDSLAANTSHFEAAQTVPEEVVLACSAMPFLGERRLVVLAGALAAAAGAPGRGSRQRGTGGWLALSEAALRLPPSTTLVLRDGPLRRDNPLLKALAPLASVREFPMLKGPELLRWLQERASLRGAFLEPAAARLLASLVGNNLWALSSEIDKLCAYAGSAPPPGTPGASAARCAITAADVQTLTPQAQEASMFALVDALVEGRASAALALLHQALADGASAPQVLGMVERQLRLVVQAKDLLQAGTSPAEAGRALGISQDFVLRKVIGQARASSFQRLERLYQLALDTDMATKTGHLQDAAALDILFAEGALR